jgi:cobalt-zinc-cadmium efflux system membrane fusion protein
MFAEVELLYKLPDEKIAVPTHSVIFDKNKYYVMVYHDRCDIETRIIEPVQANSDTTYISEGLKEGEKVMDGYHLLVYDALND